MELYREIQAESQSIEARPKQTMSDGTQIERLHELVTSSKANNTRLYDFFAKSASLEEITHFIRWDGEEPHYYLYLQQWLERVPSSIRPYLKEHIDIEINEEHSRHFQEMLARLNFLVRTKSDLDDERLETLNYTFSEKAVREQDFGFFVGGFFATEIMHCKRAGQLMEGLVRNGVAPEYLEYLRIHFEADGDHGWEIGEMMIAPILKAQPEMLESVLHGINDRISRSEKYLTWYDQTQIRRA